jgi:hypothetical protein
VALAKRIERGDKQAKDPIVSSNLRMVVSSGGHSIAVKQNPWVGCVCGGTGDA